MNGLDEYLMQEPDFCDLEEYDPKYCDECDDLEGCEIAQDGGKGE